MPDLAEPTAKNSVSQSAVSAKEESGYYEPYAYFARNLRTWFVAYGIGGPVVVLSNEAATKEVFSLDIGRPIALFFFSGVVLQILTTMLYKAAMWYHYMVELGNISKANWQYRASDWLTSRYWPEATLDAATLALFGWATLLAIEAIVP